ncbi:MAG: hypothetical protein WBO77_04485 [Microgenomates group bacterium]
MSLEISRYVNGAQTKQLTLATVDRFEIPLADGKSLVCTALHVNRKSEGYIGLYDSREHAQAPDPGYSHIATLEKWDVFGYPISATEQVVISNT